MDIYTAYWIYFTLFVPFKFSVTSSGEVLNYDTTVQRCHLDEGWMRSNLDLLEPGQGYWVGKKSVELGCSAGKCIRLIIGQTLKSRTESLDLICASVSTPKVLTRMAIQCADGYDVASFTSYDDIKFLYNRSIFPTNRSMIINNFDMPGYLTRCGSVQREGSDLRVSYRDCRDLLPAICNKTDESDLLTTLTIIEYRWQSAYITQRLPDSETNSSSSDSGEPLEEEKNVTKQTNKRTEEEASLFGLGLSSVHLISIGVALGLTFTVLIAIIIGLIKRNRRHHRDNRDPPSVKDNDNEYASWFSSKEQLTDGSRDKEEGSHYMTIPADMEYQSLQQIPATDSHVYSQVAPPGRTRVFGKVSPQR